MPRIVIIFLTMQKKNLLKAGIYSLLVGASIIACSKKGTEEQQSTTTVNVQTPAGVNQWGIKPNVNVAAPYMVFQTQNDANTPLSIKIDPLYSSTEVWIDTNNNGVFDNGVDAKVSNFSAPVTFKVTNKVWVVYGKVRKINVANNKIIQGYVAGNTSLNTLDVSHNELTAANLLFLVKSLPSKSATEASHIIIVKDKSIGTEEHNQSNAEVLKAAKAQKWGVKQHEGGNRISDFTEEEAQNDNGAANLPRILVKTDKPVGSSLHFDIEAADIDEAFFDFNNNGRFDRGDLRISQAQKEYTIASQEFTIYGKITAFLVSSLDDPENVKNEITRIKFENNNSIGQIMVFNNKLSEAAINELVESLRTIPAGERGTIIIKLNVGDNNVVTNNAIAKLKGKNWTVQEIKDGWWADL